MKTYRKPNKQLFPQKMATKLPKLNLIYENTHIRCKQHTNLNTKTLNNKNQDTKPVFAMKRGISRQVGNDQEMARSSPCAVMDESMM